MLNRTQEKELVLLNSSFLENRVSELKIKQYWLSEQLGVSNRTVLRWINGQVDRIQKDRVAALAALLGCTPQSLILTDSAKAYASPADQAEAATLIEKENLLELLTPSSNYALAESLIKAALSPNLPLPALATLYNYLALAAARQFAFERAKSYAKKAFEIGENLENKAIVAGAHYNIGWALLYEGKIGTAIDHFESSLRDARYFREEKQVASAWYSLGGAYGYLREYEKAIAALNTSVEIFSKQDHPVDSSIACFILGAYQFETGNIAAASQAFDASFQASQKANYKSGIEKARAGQASILALQGNLSPANALFESCYANLQSESFIHPLVFRYGARIACLQEKFAVAMALINAGMPHAEKFQAEKPFMYLELAKIHLQAGKMPAYETARKRAETLFNDMGSRLPMEKRLD